MIHFRYGKIADMKTILCSEYQKSTLYRSLFLQSGETGICDIQLLTINNLLRMEENPSDSALLLKLAHLLRESEDTFPIYRDMFSFAAFVQEILSFAKECALYGITADDLPKDTESEEELSRLLAAALSLSLREKNIFEQRDELLKKAAALPGLSCAVRFEADCFRHTFLEDLETISGMPAFPHEKRIPKTVSFRYASSVRQEAEALAQEIVRNNRPCGVVLCAYNETIPVVEQVFARYRIPYSALHSPILPLIPVVYDRLLQLALRKDCSALLDALFCGAFQKRCPGSLLSWLSQTLTDVVYEPIAQKITSPLLENDQMIAEHMDQMAADYFKSIADDLALLLKSSSAQEAMTNAFAVMKNSPLLSKPAELETALAIRRILNETLREVNTAEDADFVLQNIRRLQAKREGNGCAFCEITDLSHPIEPVETLYILGASGRHYPGTPVRKGLFDEAYTAKIPAFPSLEKRHGLWNDSLSWLFESSGTLIVSYPAMDYQGRQIQAAYEMESRMEKPQPWKLEKVRPAPRKEHTISPETAYDLFTKEDGTIHSSISRIERWFACPFSWFVESGLRVREPLDSVLDSRTLGNLAHAFFEQAVKTHGKEYVHADREAVDAFLDPVFSSLCAKLPLQKTRTLITKERLAMSIDNTLRFLRKMEQASYAWVPSEAEYHFDIRISEHVTLNGVIDRIDESAALVRIIDYKSSEKLLSPKKIKAGLQLQLLSYMIIAEGVKEKCAAGVYYMSMKPSTVPMDAGAFKTANKDGVPMNDCLNPAEQEMFETAKRRMNGWAFGETLIDSELYAMLFNPSKGIYVKEDLIECILWLYEFFFRQCTGGRIEVDPKEGACAFCKLRAVCRHHGGEKKAKPLFMAGNTFKY